MHWGSDCSPSISDLILSVCVCVKKHFLNIWFMEPLSEFLLFWKKKLKFGIFNISSARGLWGL